MIDIAWVRLLVAMHRITVGGWEFVDEACTMACQTYEMLGDRHRWETSWAIRAFMLLARGRFAEAHDAFGEVHASASPDGAVESRIWGRAGQIASLLPRGERHVPFLDELSELLEEAPSPADAI